MANEALTDLAEYIEENLEDDLISYELMEYKVGLSEIVLTVNGENIVKILRFLRDDPECLFETLVDITATDQPQRHPKRFDVVYNLLSLSQNNRIRVKIPLSETDQIPSVIEVYPTADWLEREIWDMFGIPFSAHPDLRRILSDYGFEGHPLRKDFPLTGHVEVRWDEELKRVVYEPVTLTQDFRVFDNLSPWEGMTDVMSLPGDEKALQPKIGYKLRKLTQES